MSPFEQDVAAMRAKSLCAESDGDGCLCTLPADHREPHGWMGEDAHREFAVQERVRAAVNEELQACAKLVWQRGHGTRHETFANECEMMIRARVKE